MLRLGRGRRWGAPATGQRFETVDRAVDKFVNKASVKPPLSEGRTPEQIFLLNKSLLKTDG